MDIKTLSNNEINRLLSDLQAEKQRRIKTEKVEFLKEIKQRAKLLGVPVEQLLSDVTASTATSKSTRKVKKKRKNAIIAPKYRNPDEAKETWAGRGRQPTWLVKKIAAGFRLDDFRI